VSVLAESFRLDGKVALVTGASSGLGVAFALGMAEAGADVAICARRVEKLEETRRQVEELGRRCIAVPADVSDPAQCDEFVATAVAQLGRVDILINNAGTILRAAAEEVTLEDWQQVLQVNLTSVFQLSQLAARDMIPRGGIGTNCGKIVNIASLLSFQGGIRVPAYAASKGGVAQLTKALANEWAPKGIQVNAIAPGYFSTTNTEALQADETRNRQILERIPAARWGQPQDLAGAALFLSSPASNYVTGTVLTVDGGWMGR
jgi:2-dehydro-3-deoxy-D-gluconate 5-dehydrogenase